MHFYGFLILQGLVMPNFSDFDYYFAIDVLGIPASLLSLQFVWIALFILVMPAIYVVKFNHIEYQKLYITVQILWIVSYLGKLSLAMGWSQQLGLPNFAVYFFFGTFLGPFEVMLTMMPGMIILTKLIPKGIEATMLALSSTIITLNQFTIRAQIGLLINATTVDVTTDNLEDFATLAWVEFLCAFIPLTFIYRMVPTIA